MPKHRSTIVEELDPQDVNGFTESQKHYYASMGYKPFRTSDGKIKWLTPDLHSVRVGYAQKRPLLKKIFKPITVRIPRRKHKPQLFKFIKVHWFFIVVVAIVTLFVLIVIRFPQLFM